MPHINYKLDFTSDAYIASGDSVLLRFHEKYKIWIGVGGHVELGEDPIEALFREMREEVGAVKPVVFSGQGTEFFFEEDDHTDNSLLPIPAFIDRHRINETHEHCAFIYMVHVDDKSLDIPEHEKTPVRWMTGFEITQAKDVSNKVKAFATQAIIQSLEFRKKRCQK